MKIDPDTDRLAPFRPASAPPPRTAPSPVPDGPITIDPNRMRANGVYGFERFDARAHAFVTLRSQLLRGFHRKGGRVLAITSTQPANGKTYVAANLAAALGQIHPTVLIDLDLRRPAAGKRFGVSHGPGVDDYLKGLIGWQATGVALEPGTLTVHRARAAQPNSSQLLTSPKLAAMFDALRAMPGEPIIIVDTPPMMILDDMMLISRVADGVLLVVEEGRTRRGDLLDAVRLLDPTPIVGSILNKSMTAPGRKREYEYYGAKR